jgi:hypothetical protein
MSIEPDLLALDLGVDKGKFHHWTWKPIPVHHTPGLIKTT